VAIFRHEFHPQYGVTAVARHFIGGTVHPFAGISSSRRATVSRVVSQTTSAVRQVAGAFHDRSASFASSGCLLVATAPLSTSGVARVRREFTVRLPLAQSIVRAHPCTRPLEAV